MPGSWDQGLSHRGLCTRDVDVWPTKWEWPLCFKWLKFSKGKWHFTTWKSSDVWIRAHKSRQIRAHLYLLCALSVAVFAEDWRLKFKFFFPSQDWHSSSSLRGNYTEGLNRTVCGGTLEMPIVDVLSDSHVLRSQSIVQVEGCTTKTIPEDKGNFSCLEFTRMDSF